MCIPPPALALVATGVQMLGIGVGTASAMSSATYQARLADRNAGMETAAAKDSLDRGRLEDRRYQEQLGALQGEQAASLAASGIDPGYGSAALIRQDAANIGQEDAQTIRENSMRETRGFEISAANYRAQAQAARQARKGAMWEGAFGMASTALGGAQQFKKMQWNQTNRGNPYG